MCRWSNWISLNARQPGTFADWQLQNFTDAQLTNSAIGTADRRPDGDGVPNLLEFAVGGNPLVADATNAVVRGELAHGNQLAFQFQERNALGNVARQFQSSGDLLNWTNTMPTSVSPLQNLGVSSLYQAVFPVQDVAHFFRIRYTVTN